MSEGNLTQDLNKFQKLYSQLLEQGRDLYGVRGGLATWVFSLEKKEREPFEDGSKSLKMTMEDAINYSRTFPRIVKTPEEIVNNIGILPYDDLNGKLGNIGRGGLQRILDGGYVVTIDLRDVHP